MKKNVVILAPISNKYINYYDAIKKDNYDNFIIFILNSSRSTYPKQIPSNIKLMPLEIWNEPYIDYTISQYFKNKIDIIFTYTEEQIEFAAKLRKKYNVPGQSIHSAKKFRNKYIMTKKARDSGLDVPKFMQVDNVFDLVNASKKIGYPLVLKPIDSMGSMDTYKIKNDYDLMNLAKNKVINNYLAEEYINGSLFHIDAFKANDQIKYLIVSKYFDNTLAYKENKSIGSVQVPENSKTYTDIKKYAMTLFNTFESPKNSIFHLEVFYDGKTIKLCEVASRLGGGRILQEIEAEFGFNPIQELLKLELNIPSILDYKNEFHLNKIRGFILTSPGEGKLRKLPTDFPKNMPFSGIYDTYRYAKLGKVYDGSHSSIEAICATSVEGAFSNEVAKKLFKIDNWIKNNTVYEK